MTTEHDLDLGLSRLLAWIGPFTISSGYLLRHWREPGERLYVALFVLILGGSIFGTVQAWRSKMVVRMDDEGIRILPSPSELLDRFRKSPKAAPPILWSEIRSARFETPRITDPTRRALLFDTMSGEHRLVLIQSGIFRLKDPPAFLAALKARGLDLPWPEDARWEIVTLPPSASPTHSDPP